MGLFDWLLGGGNTSTSTSTVSVPPEVLEYYRKVMERAAITAEQPFQPYTGEFVAPLTETQKAGIANINQATGMAQPYYETARQSLLGSAAQSMPYYDEATGRVTAGLSSAQPLQSASLSSQLAGQQAGQQALSGATAQSQPVYGTALTGLGALAGVTSPLQAQSLRNIDYAAAAAAPLSGEAVGNIARAQGLAQPYMGAAGQALGAAAGATQPMQQEAYRGIGAAQAAGAPYQDIATQYGLAGARQITPESLNIGRYMSPYIESVAEPTMRALRQQQQMEQQNILGEQIRGGAFGGDRGRIAQAVLAQQQNLATAKAMGDIYQQGYGQALGASQQQQGVQLTAEQANRAAQQAAAQQMLGIGQQGFGQNLTAAQQRAALGQQTFGQGLGMAQQQAALGQQAFGQAAQTAQQQAALSQLQYGQGMGAAQAQQTLAQQLASQGLGTAQAQAGIGQQLFGQGAQAAQQLYGMGAGTAQQQAALAQQQYAQQMGAAQQLQGIGQGLYGMGAGVSQGLAGLGAGAQAAALQGGQAQLAAGQLEQQTQQAQNQAFYNQFLQQQGYPFQAAQFYGNLAMGTGSLAGSTTSTTQPSSFFSDERLKDDIKPIGKTYDGQDIVRYRYKGEPATRIGLLAQDVEKSHPEAVGLAGGYKTVDYSKATDEAAARAPKAYGGGLSPWGDSSAYGGSVFREDAGRGYAVGGAPGGDDILAQINQLVNAHQGMYPFGKTGLYGSSSGKSGPYGSSLMQVSPRLMTATPHRMPEPAGANLLDKVGKIGSASQTISGGYGAAERALYGRPGSVTSAGSQQPGTPGVIGSGGSSNEPGYLQRLLRSLSNSGSTTAVPQSNYEPGAVSQEPLPPIYAHGGRIRPGLALGGMPYDEAEDEYIPESVSKPITPQSLQPTQSQLGKPGKSDFEQLIDIAKLGASIYAMSDKRAKENIEPIGELFDGQKVYRYNYKDKGLVPRRGYQPGGEVTLPEEWAPHLAEASRRYGVPESILSAVARQESGFGRMAPDNPMQIIESTAREPGFGLSPISREDRARPEAFLPWAAQYIAARNPNVNWEDRPAAARALASTYNAGGDPNYAFNVGRYIPGMTSDELAGLRVNVSNEPPRQQGGLGAVQPEALPILQGLTARRQPESKDFMQRNQDWIVPLLTGLGTMASSPSRYLGAAILQGIGGGALQYAGMQERGEGQDIQREQVDVSRLREINQAMQMQEQMRQRLLESFGQRLEGNMYLNPYSGELVSAQQRMAIVNSMMSNMARQMGLPSMTGAEAAGGTPPGQRPGSEAPRQPPAGGAAQPPAGGPSQPPASAPGAAGPSGLVTPATGAERPAAPDAAAVSAGRAPDYSTAFTVDTSSLRGQNNPDTLEQEASALFSRAQAAAQGGFGQNAVLYEQQATAKLKRADDIRGGVLTVRDVNGQLFRGFAQANRDRTRFDEEQKKVEEEYAKHASEGIRVYDTLTNMARTYQSGAELGAGANPLSMAAGYIQTVLGPQNTPEAMNRFLAAVQTANKENIMLAFNNLRNTGMSRGTNMALQEMLAMVPGPEMTAAARFGILTRAQAEIARDNAFYQAAMERDPRESIGAFQAKWNARPENSLDRFTQNIRQSTVGFTGMTPQEVRRYGAASAAVPAGLQGISGLEYDRDTGRFRNPADGKIYDINGTPLRGQ